MKYQSKKDEDIFAEVVSEDEKRKTAILKYLSGEKEGNTFSVTNSTLKRWWRKVDNELTDMPGIEEATKAIEIQEQKENEIFHVVVENETGESVNVDIDPTKLNIDTTKYNFNPSDDEKHYMEMPNTLKYIYHQQEDSIYPGMEELVDLVVKWGGVVKRFGWFITLDNTSRIIIHRHKKIKEKSFIEIRMKSNDIASKIKSQEVVIDQKNSGQTKGYDFKVVIHELSELEVIIKELYK